MVEETEKAQEDPKVYWSWGLNPQPSCGEAITLTTVLPGKIFEQFKNAANRSKRAKITFKENLKLHFIRRIRKVLTWRYWAEVELVLNYPVLGVPLTALLFPLFSLVILFLAALLLAAPSHHHSFSEHSFWILFSLPIHLHSSDSCGFRPMCIPALLPRPRLFSRGNATANLTAGGFLTFAWIPTNTMFTCASASWSLWDFCLLPSNPTLGSRCQNHSNFKSGLTM